MSLIPKAIELAFELQGQPAPPALPPVEHALRVWERFRRHRPLGDTPVRRYEELACVALLHDALRAGLVSEARLAEEFGTFVAGQAARAASAIAPGPDDDPDLQTIMVIDRVEQLTSAAGTADAALLQREAAELERTALPLVESRLPELARELRFQLDDLARELPDGRAGQT